MSDGTGIEWTDATWNPITGCSVVSPGCQRCYAMKLAGTRLAHHESRAGLTRETKAGPVWTGEVRLNEQWLDQPLRWRRPRMVFVCAHGDLFHEAVPDEWIDRVFAIMALAPQHTFQVLTKRAERMRGYMDRCAGRVADRVIAMRRAAGDDGCVVPLAHIRLGAQWWPLPNVWLGVSAEDQQRFDQRWEDLAATSAALRFFSFEPLLSGIDARQALDTHCFGWAIVGGESGLGARPMHPDWARSLRDQCAAAGVPFFFKQWGEWHPCEIHEEGGPCYAMHGHAPFDSWKAQIFSQDRGPGWNWRRLGKKAAGRLLDGVQHDAMPELRR